MENIQKHIKVCNAKVKEAIDNAIHEEKEIGLQVAAYLNGELVQTLDTPRANSDKPDPVMFGIPLPISIGGYWLGGNYPPVCPVKNLRTICHPRAGGSIGWADPDVNLAVAICHNKMFDARSPKSDPILPIANALRQALGLG